MIPSERLKEILVENEAHLTQDRGRIIQREGISFPQDLKKVCLLYGVRRSGKSTILFEIFRQHQGRALYIDFEDERLENFEIADFERLKESFFELKPHLLGGPSPVFLLDEIQNAPGWEKFSRRAVEREGLRVFATGSSSRVMPQEIHSALRGRSWSIEVWPFSFREFASAKQIDLKDARTLYGPGKAVVKKCFQEYLRWGGFPETAFVKLEHERRKILKEYLEAMFFKDLVERFEITNIHLLDALKDKIFSGFGQKFSVSSFCKQFKDKFPFSKDSAFACYRHFLDSMLVWEVRKLSESSYQRLRNPAKVYLVDPGLAKKVSSEDWGRLLENAVFLELKRTGLELFYFEGRRECDFVAKTEKGWMACQVAWKLGEEARKRELEGLWEACAFLGLKEGLLLTSEDEGSERRGQVKVRILPVWKWLVSPHCQESGGPGPPGRPGRMG